MTIELILLKRVQGHEGDINEAMEYINEVIEMCLEDTKIAALNKFVGFREMEVAQNA